MHKTGVLLAVCLAATSSHVFTQQPPAPTFKSGLEILTIEASVRDGTGRPVTDLQASDFVVSIDGRPRRVLNARLYGVEAERIATAGTPVPRFMRATDAEPGRLVMFAVDRDSIRSGSEKAILDTAADMMTSFSPADAVGVVGLPVGGIDPTRDHAAAAAALKLMTGTRPSVTWSTTCPGGKPSNSRGPETRKRPTISFASCSGNVRSPTTSIGIAHGMSATRRETCCKWAAGTRRPC